MSIFYTTITPGPMGSGTYTERLLVTMISMICRFFRPETALTALTSNLAVELHLQYKSTEEFNVIVDTIATSLKLAREYSDEAREPQREDQGHPAA
jgi:hypothetical protein